MSDLQKEAYIDESHSCIITGDFDHPQYTLGKWRAG